MNRIKHPKRVGSLIITLLLTAFCTGAVIGQAGTTGTQTTLDIDPSIQGVDLANVVSVMDSLPPQDRGNVVLFAQDGGVYTNKDWLKSQVPGLLPTTTDSSTSVTSVNPTLLPAFTPRPVEVPNSVTTALASSKLHSNVWPPAVYPGYSGPYRQVYSKVPANDNTPGFSFEHASIYLPTSGHITFNPSSPSQPMFINPEVYENPLTRDTACVYMGGWSAAATYISPPGGTGTTNQQYFAADAGFSHDKQPHGGCHDSWVMVVRAEHYGPDVNRSQNRAGAFRIVSGQAPVPVSFYVSYNTSTAHTYLILAVTAKAIDWTTGNSIGSDTWTIAVDVTQPPASDGGTVVDSNGHFFCPWNINGNGMVLKRMTSIAQETAPGRTGDIPTTCSFIRNAQWTGCQLGISGPSNPVASWGAANNGGAINYAFRPTIPNVVQHTFTTGLDEIDGIVIP